MRLRPVYFSLVHYGHVHSGWVRTDANDDPWAQVHTRRATAERVAQAVALSNQEGAHARAALIRTNIGIALREMVDLVNIGRAVPALWVGEQVEFTKDQDHQPFALIERGERGVIGRIDKETGQRDVFMTLYHAGLEDTGNCIWLTPHADDELDYLRRIRAEDAIDAA